jgi:hypothetical protein
MVSIQTLEKKPRRIYFALLAFLALMVPLAIHEVLHRQYLFFALEAVAFAFGVSYAVKFKRAFPCIELYRDHLTLVRGTVRKDIPYETIGILEELANYQATIYIGPKEQYLIHSNHHPGMENEDKKRIVNRVADEIKKRTGECPFVKYH